MADFAESLLNAHEAFILHEVLAEMVYVLGKVYNADRAVICEKLLQLLVYAETTDKDVITQALQTYAETKLDFVDCILFAYNKANGIEVATFDKKLKNKIANTKAI